MIKLEIEQLQNSKLCFALDVYLSEKRLHLQGPGRWITGVDLVEGLKYLIGRRTGSHHIWPLKERRRILLFTQAAEMWSSLLLFIFWGSALAAILLNI